EYRHFKIKTVRGQDDFASLREIVFRYFRRLKTEDRDKPDLLVIDGGKGQLSAGLDALKALDIKDQQVIGLAKRLEEVFIPGQKESIIIPQGLALIEITSENPQRGPPLCDRIQSQTSRETYHRHRTSENSRHWPKEGRGAFKAFRLCQEDQRTAVRADCRGTQYRHLRR
ncbi:MAG TPA: hypothetical protein ENO07_07895, partial [candidate division Zixibacteria bacterium]|nr:hypothetical protein [candidate division Zixibacteria bacterium]